MRVAPDTQEPVNRQSGIDLLIHEISHGFVIKGHAYRTAGLLNHMHFSHQQRIVRRGHGKEPDFSRPLITDKAHLLPGFRGKPQR